MASSTYRSNADQMADAASDFASKAGRQIDKAVESAESTVRSLAAQGNEAGERVQEVAGNIKGAIDKSVQNQPMTTLVMAAAVGFVLGALWKS